jgi:predicted glutamine amidotransferase
MCVIVTTTSLQSRPTLRDLALCEKQNPHGSGLAWLDGQYVHYEKELTIKQINRQLSRVDGPAIVHFRIASVGGIKPELCHPFPVTHRADLRQRGRARAVLFHNGTWREHKAASERFSLSYGREPVSDTRVAASLVARFGFDWLGKADYCRWAMLDGHGIHRIGQWSRLRGCHYSNLFWTDEPPDDGGWQPDMLINL